MIERSNSSRHRARLPAAALAFSIVMSGGCADDDRLGPTTEAPAIPALAVAAAGTQPGIVFASFGLTPSQLNTVHTGIVGSTSPSDFLTYLAQVKAKGGRVLVKLSGGDLAVRNADNTFSLAKWKSMVDRYRNIKFSSYVTDGTIVGHLLIDEPHFPSRWGNKTIPHATLEDAAKYSKQLWPSLPTMVSAPPNWLASTTISYTYLDAGWATYRGTASSSPATWASNMVSKAKSKGLGLFMGFNVLDGGDGSSGFHGNLPKKWAMSASEIRSYGLALLSQSYVCGFGMWKYKSTYYNRSDVKSAMADVSAKARSHARTSCRQ
jgi:hypothetical protein